MHVIIVFFNVARTEYPVIGPYKSLRELQRGMTAAKSYVAAHAIERAVLRAPLPTSPINKK